MTLYTSQMFSQEKFWFKKCFANNSDYSGINEITVQCKVRRAMLLTVKKGLGFTFSIV